jgi:hypothetical protein
MDFMLVHGNEWFVVPLDQPVGSLCTIEALLVRAVFGHTFHIDRADATAGPPTPGARWTMFSTTDTRSGGAGRSASSCCLGDGTAAQAGAGVEEVRFLRDDGANLVWAVEHHRERHRRALAGARARPGRWWRRRRRPATASRRLLTASRPPRPSTGSRCFPSRSTRPAAGSR